MTIASHAEAPAPDGTPDTRTTVGVCETLAFDAGGEVVDWSADKGQPKADLGKARFLWAATDVGGTATITATHPGSGQTRSIEITVVPPTTVRYTKISEQRIQPPSSIGAVMKLEGTVLPENVTFGWIAFKEDPDPTPTVTGYFRGLRRRHGVDLSHRPNPRFIRVGWNNRFRDTAGIKGPWPTPRGPGTVDWVIPNRYRCVWSTSGTGRLLSAITTQRTSIDVTGTVTVTKDGATITRSPGT